MEVIFNKILKKKVEKKLFFHLFFIFFVVYAEAIFFLYNERLFLNLN